MPELPLIRMSAVRGHERAREFLRAAIVQERLPHALLFAGPDGVGKRSLALALVAWLQCEAAADDACGDCGACRQVQAGSHPDLQLVQVAAGKKEIGIDRIRELKRFMQLQPVRGKAKVAVIDDAHLLTVAAQNALLKMLEEPPARSFLFLISASPDALLATVRSRCQRLQFAPLPVDTVAEILRASASMDGETASRLALAADGSPGRAQLLATCLTADDSAEWRGCVAGSEPPSYVRLAQTAAALGSPENQTTTKLEILLSQLCEKAVQTVRDPAFLSSTDAVTALRDVLRQAEAIDTAGNLIRRGNANRQLLLEALLFRLTAA